MCCDAILGIRRWVVVPVLAAGMGLLSTTSIDAGDTGREGSVPPFSAKPGYTYETPYTSFRIHDIGNVSATVTNCGVFGNPFGYKHPETGRWAPGAQFPAKLRFEHLAFASLWVGALVETALGYDTLVSTGLDGYYWSKEDRLAEFFPESYARGGDFVERSNDILSPVFHPEASSAQDYLCFYTDTLRDQAYVNPEPVTREPHRPLYIRVSQGSYVWPYAPTRDFIIIQYWITNLRDRPLHEMRVGILGSPSVGYSYRDELVGFLPTAPSIAQWGQTDSIITVWFADNDGDPEHGAWTERSVRSVMGIRILGTGRSACERKAQPLEYSFNWWTTRGKLREQWGPQRRPGDRSITGLYGPPEGDHQKYRFMSNGEIDFDQHRSSDESLYEWEWIDLPKWNIGAPNPYARGNDACFLLSVGPFELAPGDSIPIGIAISAGDFFHQNPDNRRYLEKSPDLYYQNLNFANLERNMQWAAWVYDNPGVDTDGDGCAGRTFAGEDCYDTRIFFEEYCWEFMDPVVCDTNIWINVTVCDSTNYAGDGIPDLRGPTAPPSPEIFIDTEPHTIHIRWSGRESELFYDPFAKREDFEGYNVYGGIGFDPAGSLELMASWDLINYDRYRYVSGARPSPWVLDEWPLTPTQIDAEYGADFNPSRYHGPRSFFEDEAGGRFYFKPHGGNRGNEYVEADRIVANQIQYVRLDSAWDEASHSWRHFGRYECTIDNLLPSQPYFFAVTAFDAGLPASGLEPLESPLVSNRQLAYPTYSPDYVEEKRLKVSVYPNPYKIDQRYRQRGFEDPLGDGFVERERRIHFANLPPRAKIKIWSLDGDLIRELHHPESRFSDTPSHTAWDLITRNTQAVTSGIYLYTVESDWGTQAGKIVIIK